MEHIPTWVIILASIVGLVGIAVVALIIWVKCVWKDVDYGWGYTQSETYQKLVEQGTRDSSEDKPW